MTIRELRKQEKLSQAEFGEKIGVAQVTVSQLETGRMKISQKIAAGVKKAFGVELEAGEAKTAKKAAAKPAAKKTAAKAAAKPAAKKTAAKTAAKPAAKKTAAKTTAKPAAKKAAKAAAKPAEKKAVKKPAGKPAAKQAAGKAPAKKPEIYIQSPYGGEITPEQILAKIPEGVDACYVRIDQNSIWWVRGAEYGAVTIW